MSRLRVVLDTNVLVSGIAYPASVPGSIVLTWRQGGKDLLALGDQYRIITPAQFWSAHGR
ncbi:hypothetical protein A6M27_16375 [Acidithiobacillus thiooxidans]|uniref:PIN domain-containing protein n=1 Tax=Acidithiobacillus thiooxidans TaxID=930 RepID=A0A1C2J7L8_ACITH|nr:hypothetical protein [Acidithiobacillus thiooxidans]OCX70540.1 hypothetical protein A6P07_14025 [Acidithiobacillus thiooxidans]OCX73171.1 hypothetical protein A6O24_12245 [Acidithiobacillus thiooxidans]OCX75020.1 hypothetical protein A6M23_04070 [Acidithiobacillus thiooxidans]OCX81581.1 hypothetical protein A6O26_12785 [Acidithiobacillus thiooxidans]OCX84250.1 hypothetical protein A6M27_16375 [Acidithiobacillus thiooxidans]